MDGYTKFDPPQKALDDETILEAATNWVGMRDWAIDSKSHP